jgi:iron(III) transport system permease protein
MLAWLPAILVLLPVLVVGWRAMQPAGDMWPQVVEHRLAGYLGYSAGLVLSVTALTLVFGISSAWVVSVYEFPGRRQLEWMMMLPIAMPGYVAALAYVDGLEKLTPLYVWVRTHHGLEAFRAVQSCAPWVFAILVLAATLYPYVFLSCRTVFARQALGMVEAARMLGASPARIFWRIALPLARPAAAAGGGLVALEALNDIGVVSLFGLPTLTPGIFRVWGEGHPGVAMRLALILLLFALVGGAAEWLLRGRRGFSDAGVSGNVARRVLGVGGWLRAWIICAVPLTLGCLLPGTRLVRWMVQSWEVVEWEVFALAAGHSIFFAGSAVGWILLGTLLILGGRRALPARSLAVAQRVPIVGYASPAALVAVGVGFIASQAAGHFSFAAGLALSASTFGLVFAGFVRYLAVAMQPAAAGLARLTGDVHHAARTLGAGPLRALYKIDLPLIRPALISGATLAFVDLWKELPMTLVLRPFNYETLPTLVFRLADQARVPEAAVPALFLTMCSLIGLIPLNYLLRHFLR